MSFTVTTCTRQPLCKGSCARLGLHGVLILGFVAAMASSVLACQFDTDCMPGSSCRKPTNGLSGVCAGGLSPGNANDRNPPERIDASDKRGLSCSFDLECGIGGRCEKGGLVKGVCVK